MADMVVETNTPQDRSSPTAQPACTTRLSELIIQRVANAAECDPTDIPPLYEAIDPDALDTLYRHGSPAVEFDYASYYISTTAEQTIYCDKNA